MAGLQGLGAGPVNFFESMVPDFRGQALQETQNQLGQAQLAGLTLQRQQQQAAAAQAQQFQQDWQAAYSSGDPSALEAVVAKYPGQMELVQKAIGFRDDNHRMALGNTARDLRIAAQSGDPAAFAQVAAKHAATLHSVGSSPQELLQHYQQNPQGTQQIIDTVGMGALGIKDYYGVENDRAKNALTQRGQDLTNARGWAGLNQQAQFHADDLQLKKLNYQQKQLEHQFKAADNNLKRQELQQKIDANTEALTQRQQQVIQGKNMSWEAAQLARSIASDPALNVVTGSVGSRLPKFDDENIDLINKAQQLQSMLTAGNLGLLKGSMSDKDLAFIKSMSSGMNVSDTGIRGSYQATKGRLEQIASKLEAGLKGYSPDYAKKNHQVPAGLPQQQPSSFSTLWGD